MIRTLSSIFIIILIIPFGSGLSTITENSQHFLKGTNDHVNLLHDTLRLEIDRTKTDSWTLVADNESMSRGCPSFAYDSQNNVIVMFGGFNGSFLDDTWILDMTSRRWSKVEPPLSPKPIWMQSMVYDSTHSVMIMFGGVGDHIIEGTWEYNVTTNKWREKGEHAEPSGRILSAMAYDSVNDATILFGGDRGTDLSNDTWIYNYSTDIWINRSSTYAPSARCAHSMAYDTRNNIIVMFGGFDRRNPLGDTWVYDLKDNRWTNKTTSFGPTARSDSKMAYDMISGKIFLFGGYDQSSRRNDTWTYDVRENLWVQKEPINSPSGRYCHVMAASANNGNLVLFGGQDNNSNPGDTWFYGIERYYDTGTYESKPYNLTDKAFFGPIQWTTTFSQNSTVVFQIRTANNSADLPKTAYVGPDGTPGTFYNISGSYLSSIHNGSKWLQYKAVFITKNDEETPILQNIIIKYNIIQSVHIIEPSVHTKWTGSRQIRWTATDPDNDVLLYDISLMNDTQSIRLVKDLPNQDRKWVWDTHSIQNGTYRIIIQAKDENPDIPLSVEASSEEFIIDHSIISSTDDTLLTVEGFPWILIIIVLIASVATTGVHFSSNRKRN